MPLLLSSKSAVIVAQVVLGLLVVNFETSLAASFNVGRREIDEHSTDTNGLDAKSSAEITKREVCETPGCHRAASMILDSMDPSVNPCDNFYQFACGKFLNDTVIPDDKSSVNKFYALNDQIKQQLRVSVEGQLNDEDPRSFKLLQSFYNTCMNTTQIEQTSEKDFREILKSLGGWPVLEGKSWNESNFNWIKSVVQLRHAGYRSAHSFINFVGGIYFDQAHLGLSQEYLSKGLQDKTVQAYSKYMVDLAEVFGANRESAEVELAESLDFEIQLAKISLSRGQRRDSTKRYNPTTVSELQSRYKSIPWFEFINALLFPHARVAPDTRVNVAVPSYLRSFVVLVDKTPKRVLANYAIWRVVAESAGLMSERVASVQTRFNATFTGTRVAQPRWKDCLTYVSDRMYVAVGALYARRYFDETAKTEALDLVENLRGSFRRMIEQITWMDDETRKAALEKLKLIEPHVGYPDEYLDNEKLDEFYQSLEADPKSHLKSYLNFNLFEMANDFEQLVKPLNKSDWFTNGQTATASAFYDYTTNSIQLPAGILQGTFFDSDRPKYTNYGAIGFIIGHEMTHGFDDVGRQFDKDGNLADWWQADTRMTYLERARCIIDQYGNYTVKGIGMKINGNDTQGENIADNGGIKEAYFAYDEWEKTNGPEPRLPGLNFTSRQMFWISAANVWCGKHRMELLETSIVTDAHSHLDFRVIGPMSNMPEFSEDFACPVGSTMNPAKKCSVW